MNQQPSLIQIFKSVPQALTSDIQTSPFMVRFTRIPNFPQLKWAIEMKIVSADQFSAATTRFSVHILTQKREWPF